MANSTTSPRLAQSAFFAPVKLNRFAPSRERSQRTQPLMRKFEIASLLPCGEVQTSHHLAPATEVFEAACSAFSRGTLIATPTGPVAMEDLVPGDLVNTVGGDAHPVTWIGATTFAPNQSFPESSIHGLIRLVSDGYSAPGALGDAIFGPSARILQTRPALEHLIGVRSVFTPVRDLEDEYAAIRITPPSAVRLFHLRLKTHAAIYANGRAVETYHPGKNIKDQMGTNMRSLFLSFFPDLEDFADFGALAYPRMSKDTLDSLTYA